jgi:hypothetical protein
LDLYPVGVFVGSVAVLVGGEGGVRVCDGWLVWVEVGEVEEDSVVVGVGEGEADVVPFAVGEVVRVPDAGGFVPEGSGPGLGGCFVSVGKGVHGTGEESVPAVVEVTAVVISGGSSMGVCVRCSSPV